MKALIDLDSATLAAGWQIYRSQEDWDSDPYASEANQTRIHGSYSYRYRYLPEKFPCLMFDCGATENSNGGLDVINNIFFYDFEMFND